MDFFSNQPSQAPDLGLVGSLVLLGILFLLFMTTNRLGDRKPYRWFFQGLQLLQLIAIYSWYALARDFPLDESLPLYHCRMAMFVVLLWPKPSKIKDYFAFLGLGGTIAAFIYPVFDPYPFLHVTIFSLILGHLALWVNSWTYLMTQDRRKVLDLRTLLIYTLVLNAFLIIVNQLTGGNYGFLSQAPLINTTNIWLNFALITLVVTVLILLMQTVFALVLGVKQVNK